MSALRLLIVLSPLLLTISLRSQDVAFYLNEMNTAPDIDKSFNAVIDSLWKGAAAKEIDSTNYRLAVDRLFGYYDRENNEITGDKAELFGYFILLRNLDYAAIITRFDGKIDDYGLRALTTISEIYRKSFLRLDGNTVDTYRAHLDELADRTPSTEFQTFYARAKEIQPGEFAPSFTALDLNGRTYTLDSLRGKIILLDFWATWCGPCIQDLPEIKGVYNTFGEEADFLLLSISLDRTAAPVRRFVADNSIAWPQIIDQGEHASGSNHAGEITTTYKAKGIPKYYLIDKKGRVRYNSHLSDFEFVPEALIKRWLSE